MKNQDNGMFGKIRNGILLVIAIITTTVSIVVSMGVNPLKNEVDEIRQNDKVQDEKIHELEKKDEKIIGKLNLILYKIDELKKGK